MSAQETVNIGSRLELMVDEHLIQSLAGGAWLNLHHPVRREIVFETNARWEGNACGYPSIVSDGERHRIYYHGLHYRHSGEPAQALDDHPACLCVIESEDGIHWRRPELGLFEFAGSKANNIVIAPDAVAKVGGDPAHTAVFRDDNPDCPPDARCKIVMVGNEPKGLYLLKSSDGFHFSLMGEQPAITQGTFDSQNLLVSDFHNNQVKAVRIQ